MRNFVLVVLLLALATPAWSQVPPAQVPVGDSVMVADTIPHEGSSPRGAFVRALIIPGWGHASVGAYKRGVVYGALQTASWGMLVKTLVKLSDVQDRADMFESAARDSLDLLIAQDTAAARRLSAEGAYEAAVESSPNFAGTMLLVNSRKDQRQDWVVLTLFFTMASAVDAYVTAHLRDFPADFTTQAGADGSVGFKVSVPVGGRGR